MSWASFNCFRRRKTISAFARHLLFCAQDSVKSQRRIGPHFLLWLYNFIGNIEGVRPRINCIFTLHLQRPIMPYSLPVMLHVVNRAMHLNTGYSLDICTCKAHNRTPQPQILSAYQLW
jgi:hypothetical protein